MFMVTPITLKLFFSPKITRRGQRFIDSENTVPALAPHASAGESLYDNLGDSSPLRGSE
jgi:hypothetical protein